MKLCNFVNLEKPFNNILQMSRQMVDKKKKNEDLQKLKYLKFFTMN